MHRQIGVMITAESRAYTGWGPPNGTTLLALSCTRKDQNSNARICKDGSLDTIRYYTIYVLPLLALASSLPAPGMSLILAGR